jgi:allophanate hydrolase
VTAPTSGVAPAGASGGSPSAIGRLRTRYESGATVADVVEDLIVRRRAAPDHHIWIDQVPDVELRLRADALDMERPSGGFPPLWGVPFAVKGNIDVAGLRTTAGCPTYGAIADRSAPVVDVLVAAGAVLVGTTNLDQFATGLVGVRSPYGAPVNPVDPLLVPGGSSSGSAVAVAEGWVGFALGTDTAGSGRVPAAMCEVVGLKPAVGRWPTDGVVPACRSLDCVSVFADSIADAALVASVLDGGGDAWSPAADSPLRIGIPDPATMTCCEPETAGAFDAQVERLVTAGHEVVSVDLAAFVEVGDLLYGPWVAERAESVGDFVRGHVGEVDPVVAGIVLGGYEVTADDVVHGRAELDAARQGIEPIWSVVDVLLTPTIPFVPTIAEVLAEPIDLNRRLGTFTHPVNLLGWIAASVPGPRRADGRPSGVTVLAPPGRERAMTSVAADAARSSRP